MRARGLRVALVFKVFLTFVGWCLAFGCGLAEEIPAVPPNHIYDEARVFQTEPERLEALASRLEAFEERHGFQIHVACFGSLIGTSVYEQSGLLRQEWLGEEAGLVLAIEMYTGRWDIAWQGPATVTSESGDTVPTFGGGRIAPQDQIEIRTRMAALPRLRTASVDDLETMMGVLLDGLEEVMAVEARQSATGGRLIVLALGLLAAMLLVAMLIHAGMKKAYGRVEDRLYFPEVRVHERLGAPMGGGKVSSRSFRGPSA